ncbi:AbrB family transcriptional regulator, partial [Bacillus sp. B4EP4a]
MVVLSEEMKDSDETVVGFMQTLRVILVISIVPWIVTHVMSVGSGT